MVCAGNLTYWRTLKLGVLGAVANPGAAVILVRHGTQHRNAAERAAAAAERDGFKTDSTSSQLWQRHGSKAVETMATSEPGKFCQMVAGLLPKEMHIKDEPL